MEAKGSTRQDLLSRVLYKKGIDFDEIFSFGKITSIRTIFTLVVLEYLHLEQLDVNINFLHGELEEENLYVATKGV